MQFATLLSLLAATALAQNYVAPVPAYIAPAPISSAAPAAATTAAALVVVTPTPAVYAAPAAVTTAAALIVVTPTPAVYAAPVPPPLLIKSTASAAAAIATAPIVYVVPTPAQLNSVAAATVATPPAYIAPTPALINSVAAATAGTPAATPAKCITPPTPVAPSAGLAAATVAPALYVPTNSAVSAVKPAATNLITNDAKAAFSVAALPGRLVCRGETIAAFPNTACCCLANEYYAMLDEMLADFVAINNITYRLVKLSLQETQCSRRRLWRQQERPVPRRSAFGFMDGGDKTSVAQSAKKAAKKKPSNDAKVVQLSVALFRLASVVRNLIPQHATPTASSSSTKSTNSPQQTNPSSTASLKGPPSPAPPSSSSESRTPSQLLNVNLYTPIEISKIIKSRLMALQQSVASRIDPSARPANGDACCEPQQLTSFMHPMALEPRANGAPAHQSNLENNAAYRFAYGVAYTQPHLHSHAFFDSLVKFDSHTQEYMAWFKRAHVCSEPERVEEDDGVVLSVVLDGTEGKSYLLVLDAKTFDEVARAEVGVPLSYGLRGAFVVQ
ncbi:hypothetical protein HDU98_009310 [Podochytrium sp. JEL0797]|nr:hypothetical protein HDU98_009310 [Podochytrium sp. JEL0797]